MASDVRHARLHASLTRARLLAFGAAAVMLVGSTGIGASRAAATATPTPPLLGVLQPDPAARAQELAAGVRVVTIGVSWASAQPQPGGWDDGYLTRVRARITDARASGLKVVLDPGIQYPPDWVFALPGGTRFVDQDGVVRTAPRASGEDAANAVTNSAVRAAVGDYLDRLGAAIPRGQLWAVRQGGGPTGELRYPEGIMGASGNSYWAYDESTQAALPASVRGWRPGTGTTTQARTFLAAYNRALVDYGIWLGQRLTTDFDTRLLLMLPGWGQRPGVIDRMVASRLTIHFEEFNQGLDWADLFARTPADSRTIAYTTYLDAPAFAANTELTDPAHFIARLAAPRGWRLGGENTGNGSLQLLNRSLRRAKSLGYRVVNWMSEVDLVAPGVGEPTWEQFGTSARQILVTG